MRALFAILTVFLSFGFTAGIAFAGGSAGAVIPPYFLPEPASLAVLGIGVGALVIIRRFRK